MTTQRSIIALSLLLSSSQLFARPADDLVSMLGEMFEPDGTTNLTIVSYSNCPPQYTNVISNTNLFTAAEQKLLQEVLAKYKGVTTNSGPPGSVLTGLDRTNSWWVAHFSYTNSGAHEDITFGDASAEGRFNSTYDGFVAGLTPFARFRNNRGDGYDVRMGRPDVDRLSSTMVAQIRQGVVNGLFVDFENDHCETLLRFVNGKAVHQWFTWDVRRGNRFVLITIKSPLDYFKYMGQEFKN
jgi:hypothetical protein